MLYSFTYKLKLASSSSLSYLYTVQLKGEGHLQDL
jgi:hypothetical protein